MADRDRNFDRASDDLNRAADKTSRAADNALHRHDEPATTGDVVGEGVGGVSGLAAGAAIGSLGGPIGTVIGAIAGAVGGWWAGRAVSEAAGTFTDDDDAYYRRDFSSSSTRSSKLASDTADYDSYRPAYQLGQVASRNPEYADRDFDAIENDLRTGWTGDVATRYGEWDKVRDRARAGFERGREQRLTLSEEQLAVGKKQVSAGEAAIRKTVETEHVTKNVPVQREEVTVERRPLNADSARNVDIGEDEIRVPLTREEVVVEKRAVPTEELVVKKRTVTENQQVEADLRREKVDDSQIRNATANLADRAAVDADRAGNAVERGAKKTANKLDDLKDRVDGNPASRPGPDPTDSSSRF